jgi:hypothetical protein
MSIELKTACLYHRLGSDAFCSFGAGIPLLPPHHGIALSGRCSSGDA